MNFKKVTWSPVEIEYLKKNKSESLDQLTIALAKSRSAVTNKLKELSGKGITKTSTVKHQSKIGKRKDLGIFLRSGWEADFMRICNTGTYEYMFVAYEPAMFPFTDWVKPQGLALSYTPDFKVMNSVQEEFWVEVKGNWLRPQDKTKLRRFKQYYPDEFKKLLAVVGSKKSNTAKYFKSLGVPDSHIIEFLELKKIYKSLPEWESQ